MLEFTNRSQYLVERETKAASPSFGLVVFNLKVAAADTSADMSPNIFTLSSLDEHLLIVIITFFTQCLYIFDKTAGYD